jgi:Predicted metal-dependent hydrolase of the TIM-barrel fold
MTIDSHQHFWRYNPVEFDWISDAMARIRRDFLPDDLAPQLAACGIDGTVAVQARMNLEETRWLLELSDRHALIKGVVGWVPLAEPSVGAELDRFRAHPRFKGVRHVVQGQPAGFLDAPAFNAGIREVTTRGLVYDILIFANQLEETIRFVDRHPNQVFVLDHVAKPVVQGPPDAIWMKQIRELARRKNVACKFSGVVTEIPGFAPWTPEQIRPYFDVVLNAFGPQRLMFGSDWPPCLVSSEYVHWHQTVQSFTTHLSDAERARILGGTAVEWYRL